MGDAHEVGVDRLRACPGRPGRRRAVAATRRVPAAGVGHRAQDREAVRDRRLPRQQLGDAQAGRPRRDGAERAAVLGRGVGLGVVACPGGCTRRGARRGSPPSARAAPPAAASARSRSRPGSDREPNPARPARSNSRRLGWKIVGRVGPVTSPPSSVEQLPHRLAGGQPVRPAGRVADLRRRVDAEPPEDRRRQVAGRDRVGAPGTPRSGRWPRTPPRPSRRRRPAAPCSSAASGRGRPRR